MPNTPADSIRELTKRVDELNYAVGDTLDVKSSIILVVITLLGTVSGGIVATANLPATIKLVQSAAVLALVVAGVLTLIALWPREFSIPPRPERHWDYLNGLEQYYAGEPHAEQRVVADFDAELERLARERIICNNQLASKKTKLNSGAFYATAVAVTLELVSLSWFAFAHLF
jgi:hypothetical protein